MFFMKHTGAFWRLSHWILFLSILSWDCRVAGALTATPLAADSSENRSVTEQPSPAVIVIGFVGGFIKRDNAVHQEVQLANRLRNSYASCVSVRMFENHLGGQARKEILRLLDTDHNGVLSAEERLKARIVLYGHSWGASEAITMARLLQKDAVQVLLTIQVDSVCKPGQDDRFIPANVAQAINFYQLNGLLHGRREILAADPSRTEILGNVRVDYKSKPISCDEFPWFAKLFMKPHIEIESDPMVWDQVESLIRSKLPSATVVSKR
jgi:hypothetical protein